MDGGGGKDDGGIMIVGWGEGYDAWTRLCCRPVSCL